ncbi:aspartate carbamoyltransferase catalytic subunit [Candidatus Woesearchaeota archaeon]|nr:aspartate carbamoyltransferase catalytic subunit [Candidatus Woesearchaeota archaeon]
MALKGSQELSTKDIISMDDLSVDDIKLIFRITYPFKEEFIKRPNKKIPLLKGKFQMDFFFEESTRTRTSFELAGKHLSADVINASGSSTSMAKKGETLMDTVRTYNSMAMDIITMRHGCSGAAQMIANEIRCPIVNAGDGCHEHPTQGLLDMYTIYEAKGKIEGLDIVIVGDILHSRVAGSLIRGLRKMGARVRLAGPPTFIPYGIDKVFGVKVYDNLDEAIKDVDVVYALRVQLERAASGFIPSVREYSKNFCITPSRLKMAKPDAIVMHPGPINREVDLRTEVMECAQSKVEEQVTNGFCVRLALLYLLVRGDPGKVHRKDASLMEIIRCGNLKDKRKVSEAKTRGGRR